jgi:hypothetical protein
VATFYSAAYGSLEASATRSLSTALAAAEEGAAARAPRWLCSGRVTTPAAAATLSPAAAGRPLAKGKAAPGGDGQVLVAHGGASVEGQAGPFQV